MKDIKQVKACVVDHGQFTFIAERLARDFDTVFYFSSAEDACPVFERGVLGDGFPNLVKVANFWDIKDQCDLFVFPDIGYGGEQMELVRQGKLVFGSRHADVLESDRIHFLNVIKSAGLDVPPYKKVRGIKALREMLKTAKDVWIKLSTWRGSWETFHWRDWDHDEMELTHRELKLGPLKEAMTFAVFDKLDIKVEDGTDTWCVGGRWPETIFHGLEKKDEAYIGTFSPVESVSPKVWEVNHKLSPVFERYDYRGAFSTEVALTGGKQAYFIDATCRFGSPPSQSQCEAIGNFSEMVYATAAGEVVEPDIAHEFAIQLRVDIKRDYTDWDAIVIPPKLRQWLKCSFCCMDGDVTVFPPPKDNPRAWLVGVGDTVEDAVNDVAAKATLLPDGVSCRTEPIKWLLDEIHRGEGMGVQFTDQDVPTSDEVEL